YRSPQNESEPLVPRPSFVFDTRGQQSSPLINPPSYNSISAHELYRDIVNVFPDGSPHHRLSNPVPKSESSPKSHQQRRSSRYLSDTATTISYTTDLTESSDVNCQRSTRHRRPLSVNLNDESYLNWSANTIDEILSNVCSDNRQIVKKTTARNSMDNNLLNNHRHSQLLNEQDEEQNSDNTPPPPPAPPLPENFVLPSSNMNLDDDDNENDDDLSKTPPEVPPRQRRNRTGLKTNQNNLVSTTTSTTTTTITSK
ncbi:hypothetical protein BLA29_008057, partial [Euroglyphus maynei]